MSYHSLNKVTKSSCFATRKKNTPGRITAISQVVFHLPPENQTKPNPLCYLDAMGREVLKEVEFCTHYYIHKEKAYQAEYRKADTLRKGGSQSTSHITQSQIISRKETS